MDPRRRKAASGTVAFDRRSLEVSQPTAAKNAGFWEGVAGYILPSPATANQRLRLARLVTNDIALIVLGSLATRASTAWLTGNASSPELFNHLGLPILYGTIFTLIGYSERLYHPGVLRNAARQRLIVGKALLWSTLLMCLAWSSCARSAAAVSIAYSGPLNFFLLLARRRYERAHVSTHRPRPTEVRNVLIIGAASLGREVACRVGQDCTIPRVVRGFLDDSYPAAADVLGGVDSLSYIARKEFIDEVVVTLPLQSQAAQKAISQARRNRLDVKAVPFVSGTKLGKITVETLDDIPLLTLYEEVVPSVGLLLKRVADIGMSTIGLLALLPLLGLIALAIKADSRGSVLYRAPRVGFKGMRFDCYKFRTMVANADDAKEKLRQQNEREGAFFKMKDDPRITRVGRILRRYSLDELPQLWNVLRGEMSMVGPRPHPLDDAARYRVEDLQRLEVMPGITGLWQVTARRDPSFERSMALDREYIGRWSLGMDLHILCKTVGAVLRGNGS